MRPTGLLVASEVATSKMASEFCRITGMRVRRKEGSEGYPSAVRRGEKALTVAVRNLLYLSIPFKSTVGEFHRLIFD
jgi:hypothetical protein